jgi:hypothetical protein
VVCYFRRKKAGEGIRTLDIQLGICAEKRLLSLLPLGSK